MKVDLSAAELSLLTDALRERARLIRIHGQSQPLHSPERLRLLEKAGRVSCRADGLDSINQTKEVIAA